MINYIMENIMEYPVPVFLTVLTWIIGISICLYVTFSKKGKQGDYYDTYQFLSKAKFLLMIFLVFAFIAALSLLLSMI